MTKIFHLNQNNYDVPQLWGEKNQEKKHDIEIIGSKYITLYSVLKCHTM